MHVAIRRYELPAELMTDLKEKIQNEFVPEITRVSGFNAYYAVQTGSSEIATVSVFETADGTDESTRMAAEFVQRYWPGQTRRISVDEGETLVERHVSMAV
jgi:hypothetical protein